MSGFDVGGVRGGSPPAVTFRRDRQPRSNRLSRKQPRIWFWREIFRHINSSWENSGRGHYFWTNGDRKILANLARKYGTVTLMAMWDVYLAKPGSWFNQSHGSIYGLVNDGERLRDLPEFKERRKIHQERLDNIRSFNPAAFLKGLGL